MKIIKDFDLKGKRVLLRCDFDVPLDNKGKIEDDSRIKASIETINYLLKNKARIILIGHLGRPKGKVVESLRIDPVLKRLEDILSKTIKKVDEDLGEKTKQQILEMKEEDILIFENIRFYKQEEENDTGFSKKIASFADIYINDAFGTCHRDHASITGIPKFIPSGAGLLLSKEIEVFSKVLNISSKPLVFIIGGAKIEDKLVIIEKFLEKADHLLIGGKVANEILISQDMLIGKKEKINNIDFTSRKLHLPMDAIVSKNVSGKEYRKELISKVIKGELVLDIGPETINIFSEIIKEAKMIVWAGPMGYFENSVFERGTKEIANSIVKNQKAYKIIGGGDTVSAVKKFNLIDKFDHVSTGGGAMLDFLGGEKLVGIEALGK